MESVDMQDLKSCEPQRSCGFKSRPGYKCNDLEISDGTDAKYEMETFETRIKVWIRYKPYRRYIYGSIVKGI